MGGPSHREHCKDLEVCSKRVGDFVCVCAVWKMFSRNSKQTCQEVESLEGLDQRMLENQRSRRSFSGLVRRPLESPKRIGIGQKRR